MRGFLGGLAIGLVTVVLGVVALTMLSPGTPRPDVGVDAPVAMGNDQGVNDAASVVAATVDNDLIQMAPTDITGPDSRQDTIAALDGTDTDSADKPVISGSTPSLQDPGAGPGSANIDVTGDVPVAILTPTNGLNAPQGDGQPGTLIDPVQPVVSDGSEAGSGFGSGTANLDTSPVITSQSDPARSVAGTDQALGVATAAGQVPAVVPQSGVEPTAASTESPGIAAADAAQDRPPVVSNSRDSSPGVQVSGQTSAPIADQLPVTANQDSTLPTAQSVVVAGLDRVPEVGHTPPVSPIAPSGSQIAATPSALPLPSGGGASVPEVDQSNRTVPPVQDSPTTTDTQTTLPQAGAEPGSLRPTIGTRVVPLTERNAAGVGTIRLAGNSTPATNAEVAGTPGTPGAAGAATTSAGAAPLEVNGEVFENPENRPLMAIVLIDDGASLGIEALAEFPYPVSFAIDPGDPDAASKMARHRAAGFEVVLIADLPRLATAQDAETSLSVWLNELPEAVALLEGTGTGIQGNRDLSAQVTAIVEQRGLGLIMQARGLNTAFKLATRDNVPAALVFRDFDGAGQTPVVMRRFLDQAAFRAGQNGGVIMLGRLRPDTISALLIWGLQDRVSRVSVAPVSAVLKAK